MLDSAERTIRFKKPIDLIDRVLGMGSWSERHYRIIEGAFHREGSFRGSAVDPQDRAK
jgi:hypothetical protein